MPSSASAITHAPACPAVVCRIEFAARRRHMAPVSFARSSCATGPWRWSRCAHPAAFAIHVVCKEKFMKLYTFSGSCALATHIVLEWIGKPYDLELIQKDDLAKPGLRKLNPNGY